MNYQYIYGSDTTAEGFMKVNENFQNVPDKASILNEANSYTDIKKTEAVNEAKEWSNENFSKTNMLDNWYFADPINQRGQNQYAGLGYGIDRWHSDINPLTVTINSGYTTIYKKSSGGHFNQSIEMDLRGKQVTCSVLFANGELYHNTFVLAEEPTFHRTIGDAHMYARFDTSTNKTVFGFYFNTLDETTLDIVAAKMELGAVQTLARQENDVWVLNDPPPNKQQELAKCQRYYWRSWSGERNTGNSIFGQVFADNKGRVTGFQFPVAMRTEPTITVYGRNGVGKITEWKNDEDYGDVWPAYWDERRCVALAYSGGQLDMGAYVYYFVEVNAEL